MAEMLHKVVVRAGAERVYDAIATQAGVSGWWTADSVLQEHEGGEGAFGFGNRGTVFRMVVEQLDRPRRVVWRCVDGHEQWEGTRLIWDIKAAGEGKTKVRFTHSGWRSRQGWYATCNTTWGALMQHLKGFVEGTGNGPFFEG